MLNLAFILILKAGGYWGTPGFGGGWWKVF